MRSLPGGLLTCAALLAGCGPDEVPTGPRTWDGEFLIDSILIECDEVGWTYDVYTLGWGDVVSVDLVGREYGVIVVREKLHHLPEVEYGDGWARHRLELDQAGPYEAYEPSVSTAVPCEAKTFVTYGFGAWRYDGELEECVAWGMDPEGEFPDCANWGENGHQL
jgi:hypothetical protein